MIGCGNKNCGACKSLMRYEAVDRASAQRLLVKIGNLYGKMIDGGAHVGLWSLSMIKWYQTIRFPTPKIVAIEPNHKTASILMRNLDGTHASCVILEAALWKDSSALKLRAGTSPAQDMVHENGMVNIEAITLDYIFKNIGEVDLIKLDIEGSEHEAIEGGERLFKSGGTKLLVMEFRANHFKEKGTDPYATVRLLKSFGYIPFHNEINKVKAVDTGVNHTYNVKFIRG